MNVSNRIDSLSVSPTTARQTPRRDFGEMLVRAGSEVPRIGGLLASGVTSGSPVLSAAVAGIASVVASNRVTPSEGLRRSRCPKSEERPSSSSACKINSPSSI